ncbi:LamG-like jellyroll fold domain-containing protein [Nonlabens xiamenensis]|uniref:LamG-like jellyroll fold domain-containing protein n=1 Tax=Nonlabens xiamenensis TaxID=2341043 RepID=UPI000F60F3F5|nr:LamG-like jellyroll fold domain-containing protein [Nonlabens xiamenensis]
MKNFTHFPKYSFFSLAFAFFVSAMANAQSSQVNMEIDWPAYSGENYIIMYDPSGTEIGRYCNPAECYTGSSVSYYTNINLGCLPNGNNYRVRLYDRANDGWDGGGDMTITAGGATVLNARINGSQSGTDFFFNVNGGGCGATGPEINIIGNGNGIVDGDNTPDTNDNTDFGTVDGNNSLSQTFSIQNTGSGALTLTGSPVIQITGANAGDFSVSSAPATTIASGGSENFTIVFSRATLGTSNATVTIVSDDADEANYNFDIQATSASPVSTIFYENFDDGAAGWNSSTNGGFRWSVGTVANEPGEGNYWYTDNWNNYPAGRSASVTGPTISTVGYSDLNLYIDFRTNTNDTDDGMRVEYSANNGTTWNVLGSDTSGTNWYNSGDVDGFANNADAWTGDNSNLGSSLSRFEEASHALPAVLENNPAVRFRVSFASDGDGTRDDGALFDNIIITGRRTVEQFAPDGPADVNDQLTLWLRSTDIPSTDGTTLTTWEDLAFDNDAFEAAANAPKYANNVTNNINFNPTVAFDRSQQQHMRGKGGFNSNDYWIVVRSTIDMTNSLAGETMLIGAKSAPINPAKDPSGLGWGPVSVRFDDEVLAHSVGTVSENDPTDGSYGRSFSNTTRTFDDVHIVNVKNNPANNSTEIYLNGRKIDNQTGVTQVSRQTLDFHGYTNRPYYLAAGRYQLNGLPFETHLNGEITEVFSYRDRKSELVQQRIYSYLAIKNGVSLHNPTSTADDHAADWDYLNADDAVIWDYSNNTSFNYDVAAIGRDDKSELFQKQSKSENSTSIVALGLNRVEDLGTQNSQTFENDQDFLFWGHNGQDTNASGTIISHDIGVTDAVTTNITVMNRKWKANEVTTTDVPTTEMRVETADFAGLPALTANRAYVLLVADDANFTTGLETRFFVEDGIYQRTKYDFDGTKYFTLGITEVTFEDRSVVFDGVDDHITVDNPPGLGSTFSCSAWIISEGNNATNTERTIVAKRENGTGFQLSLMTDNHIALRWNATTPQELISNTALNDGTWRHIGFSYDGAIARIYIDGVLDIEATLEAPDPDGNLLGIGARIDADETTYDHFKGEIDEIRMWGIALTANQLRYVMNQELRDESDFLAGSVIPSSITKNEIAGIPYSSLKAYYSMNSFLGTSLNDQSVNQGHGRMGNENYFELRSQTAPLPYRSAADGDWEDTASWANGSRLHTPASTRVINGTVHSIDWNIVATDHAVTIDHTDATVLGLFVDTDQLTVDNDHGLTVTHLLDLQSKIDLIGESQLVQTTDSDLATTTTGVLERDQQGTGVTFDYNYWSSPVSLITDPNTNNGFTLNQVFKDGTLVDNPRDINWTAYNQYNGAPGNASTAASISTRWIYKYGNLTSGTYSNWEYVGQNGALQPGEGWTMKGTDITGEQNYVFQGKPNNGDINLPINTGNDYLIGNPYPSALDAHEFIADNPELDGTLYFWEHWGGNTHVYRNYQGGYAMYNYSGGVGNATLGTSHPDINQGGIATKVPERFVPVAQGFFVTGTNDGNIRFRNDQRQFVTEASGGSIFVAAPGSGALADPYGDYNTITDPRTKFRIGFDGPNVIHRQLLLTLDPNATMGYDRGFDGRRNDEQMDDMAFIIGNEKAVIQGIPGLSSTMELPLSVKVLSSGSITIKLDGIKNVDPNQKFFLKDAVDNTYTDLMNGDYVSPVLNSGIYDDRFSIVFETPSTLSNSDVVLAEGDLVVFTPSGENSLNVRRAQDLVIETMSLTNMLGQQVITWDVSDQQGVIAVSTEGIASGSYIVTMDTNFGPQSRKVIIQ